ncbi:non-hydrolyzing UDP-N-acetylglucosamine 2-epimerase [Achromobacter xylosoxidans]
MLLSIVGNRPQFIKMAPISTELRARGLADIIVHSGQHYDENMSDIFFREMGIPKPEISLTNIERSHSRMTAEIMIKMEEVFLDRRPTGVVIYGDTNTTLAAALVAVKMHIPIAHVEAGPRIYDLKTPEEINRLVADHAAQLLFCPDAPSVENLKKENIIRGVHLTGDLMYDSFLHFLPRAQAVSTVLERCGLKGEEYALVTIHRPNNTDDPVAIKRLVELCERFPMKLLFAVHPRTKAALQREGMWEHLNSLANVRITEPLGYLDILAALDGASLVLTDSGGLQKEGYFARKPVIALFHISPWPLVVADGWINPIGCLSDIDTDIALAAVHAAKPGRDGGDYFGDGRAAKKIVDLLIEQGFSK